MSDRKFPKYVNMISENKNFCTSALRLIDKKQADRYGIDSNTTKPIYFRDAGDWYVLAEFVGDKILTINPYNDKYLNHLNGQLLVEISKEEWAEDNKGYI